MKCYKCGKGMMDVDTLIPIDPKGTENRRWSCLKCAPKEKVKQIPKDIKDICNIVGKEKL